MGTLNGVPGAVGWAAALRRGAAWAEGVVLLKVLAEEGIRGGAGTAK